MPFNAKNLMVHFLDPNAEDDGLAGVMGSCTGCTCTERPLTSCDTGTALTPLLASAASSASNDDLQKLHAALAGLQAKAAARLS